MWKEGANTITGEDMDDFFEWLCSPKGEQSEEALFEVMNALDNSVVDPKQRLIVWADGKHLSIAQTAQRIHLKSKLPLPQIESHVIGWLEMNYEPEGLSDQQMDEFETMIDNWIRDHQASQGHDP